MRCVVALLLALGLTEQVGEALMGQADRRNTDPWTPECGRRPTLLEYSWVRISMLAELDEEIAREAAIASDDTRSADAQVAALTQLNAARDRWRIWDHYETPVRSGCSDPCPAVWGRAETIARRERSIYDLPVVSGRHTR